MHKKWNEILTPSIDNDNLWELFHANSGCTKFESPKQKKMGNFPLNYETCAKISLNQGIRNIDKPLSEVIKARTSAQTNKESQINKSDIATLLINSYSLKSNKKNRTIPSAGATYPIEIYFSFTPQIEKETTLKAGLYYYNSLKNELRRLRINLSHRVLEDIFIQTDLLRKSTLQLYLTALFPRSTQRYNNRGYRFALLEAGHIAQNLNLIATAMGLSCTNIGGYYENIANNFLQIDGISHSVVYCMFIR